MKKQLEKYFRAVYPGVSIRTTDEDRALEAVKDAALAVGSDLVVWTITKGIVAYNLKAKTKKDLGHGTAAPGAMTYADYLIPFLAAKHGDNVIAVIVDVDTLGIERSPLTQRALRDFVHGAPDRGASVVFISGGFTPPTSLASMVVTVEHPLPSDAEIAEAVKHAADTNGIKSVPNMGEVVQSLSGLTATKAENAMSVAIVETGRIDPAMIYREKSAVVRESGTLELVAPDPAGLDGIGGLTALKAWIRKRVDFGTPEAIKYGLRRPRGVLIVGVSGTGKSLAAKAIGTALRQSTLRLDMGAIFGMLVGDSEKRARETLAIAEAVAPCVLWMDEIEKGFPRAGTGDGDGGAAKRVLQTFLTWMQEHTRPVFLVATANNVSALPPELMRKGRFDEIFTVDLPNEGSRAEILRIHLKKRRRQPDKFDVRGLSGASTGYTGAEIEAAIDDAMVNAWGDGKREVTSSDVLESLSHTVPLSVTMAEQVEAVRAWGRGRARSAD